MLTLDTALKVSASVLFTAVGGEVVLLNTLSNQYYALDEVGAHFWGLLTEGKTLRKAYASLLKEFEVKPAQLEQDLLELVAHLQENGLIEITEI